jgi:hypothetical protein
MARSNGVQPPAQLTAVNDALPSSGSRRQS